MKKLAYAIGGLVVLLLVAAFLVPTFVDLNDYKPLIAAEVKKATGRDLVIDGSIDLALLPSPRVSIGDVRLGNIPGAAAPDMITLDEVEAAVAFGPLLEGRLQVTSITLVQPVVTLERLADGRANWELAEPGDGTAAETGSGGGIPIALDNIVVDGGTLIYRDAAQGVTYQADRIDAIASARSLQGPFALTGTFVTQGRTIAVDAKVGDLAGPALPLSLAATSEGVGSASFAGTLKGLDASPEAAGTVEVSGQSLAAALAALTGAGAGQGPLARPFSLKGTVAASEAAVSVNDLAATLGDVRATGALNVVPGDPLRVDGAVVVNQVDLDALLAAAPGEGKEGEAAAPASPAAFALPAGIAGGLDATIEAVVFKGEVVRQVHVVVSLDEGALTVSQATALLPGGSDLSLFGVVTQAEGTPAFDGQVEAASDDLRALFRWLGADVAGVPAERLRKFSFGGAIRATPAGVSIRDGDLRFDNSRLTGAIDVALAGPLRVTADVALDKLNLDAYLPPADPAAAEGQGGGAPAGIPADLAADIKATVGQITARGVAVRDLVVDGAIEQGRVTLRKLAAADVGGARIDAQGLVDPAGGAYDLTVGVDAKDIGGLARLAGIALPVPAETLGAVAIAGTFKGDAKAVALDASIATQPATVRAQGTVGGLPDAPTFDIAFSGDAARPQVLLDAAGVTLPVDAAALAPLAFKGTWKGDLKAGDLALDATVPPAALTLAGSLTGLDAAPGGDLKLGLAGPSIVALARALGGPELLTDGAYDLKAAVAGNAAKASVDATLAALGGTLRLAGEGQDLEGKAAFQGTLDVDHPELRDLGAAFAPAQPGAPPLGALDLAAAAKGDATGATLTSLTAALGPNRLEGQGDVRLGEPRPAFKLDLTADQLLLDPFLGADGAPAEAAPAEHQWSSEPLDLSALTTADGTASLKAKAIVAGAWRLDDADIQLVLKDGVLTIQRLAGTTFGGALQATGNVSSADVNGAGLDVKLTGADVRRLLAETAGYDDLSGRLDFALKADTVGGSERDLVRNLAGDAQVVVHDGVVDGFDLTAINQRLGQLDTVADFAALAGTSLTGGQTRFTAIDGTFLIDQGVARSNDLRALMEGAEAHATAEIDLPQWRLAVDGTAQLLGHSESPPLGLRMRGPLDQPTTTFDTKALQAFLASRAIGGAIKAFGEGGAGQSLEGAAGNALGGAVGGVIGGAAGGALGSAIGGALGGGSSGSGGAATGGAALPTAESEAALPTAEGAAALPEAEPETAVPEAEAVAPEPEAAEPEAEAAEPEPEVVEPEPEAVEPEPEAAAPAEEQPAEEQALPEAEEQAVPEAEEPVLPEAEEPVLPQAEEPALPEAEEPALPEAEESVLPQAEEEVLPEAEEPALPAAEEPVLPEAEEPVLPQAEEPVLPEAEEPALPAAEEPALPEAEVLPQAEEPLPPAEGALPEAGDDEQLLEGLADQN